VERWEEARSWSRQALRTLSETLFAPVAALPPWLGQHTRRPRRRGSGNLTGMVARSIWCPSAKRNAMPLAVPSNSARRARRRRQVNHANMEARAHAKAVTPMNLDGSMVVPTSDAIHRASPRPARPNRASPTHVGGRSHRRQSAADSTSGTAVDRHSRRHAARSNSCIHSHTSRMLRLMCC
jgi:hypothetical protein